MTYESKSNLLVVWSKTHPVRRFPAKQRRCREMNDLLFDGITKISCPGQGIMEQLPNNCVLCSDGTKRHMSQMQLHTWQGMYTHVSICCGSFSLISRVEYMLGDFWLRFGTRERKVCTMTCYDVILRYNVLLTNHIPECKVQWNPDYPKFDYPSTSLWYLHKCIC